MGYAGAKAPATCHEKNFMRKLEKTTGKADDMRAEYRLEDLGTLERGKYAARYAQASNVVVIDDALTTAFPNAQAVNDALRSLLNRASDMAKTSKKATRKIAVV